MKPAFQPPFRNIFMPQPDKGSPSKPIRSISPINSNKIQNLQKQFQSLKQKIKEVELKNSEMLNKIKSKINKTNDDDELSQQIQRFKHSLNHSKPDGDKNINVLADFIQTDGRKSKSKEKRYQQPQRNTSLNQHEYYEFRQRQKQRRASKQGRLVSQQKNMQPQDTMMRRTYGDPRNYQNAIEKKSSSPVIHRATNRSNSNQQYEFQARGNQRVSVNRNQKYDQKMELVVVPPKIQPRYNLDSLEQDEYPERPSKIPSKLEQKSRQKIPSKQHLGQQQNRQNRLSPQQLIKQAKKQVSGNINNFEQLLVKTFTNINRNIEQLNKKILSLDMSTEQLKRAVTVDRRKSTQVQEFKKIRQRQDDFIRNQMEAKVKKLNQENQRLERIVIEKNFQIQRLNEELSTVKDVLVDFKEIKVKDDTKKQELLVLLKKKQKEADQKSKQLTRKHDQQIKKLQDELSSALKSISNSNKRSDTEQNNMMYSFHPGSLRHTNSSAAFERFDTNAQQVIEELEAKNIKLDNENKQYQNLLLKKSDEVTKMQNKVYENELMSGNMKKMLEQLMEQHEKIQNVSAKKDIEHMQALVKITQSQKKRTKQLQQQKSRLVKTLQQACDKKVIRKVRKQCETELQQKLSKISHFKQDQNNINNSMLQMFHQTCNNFIKQLVNTISYYQNQQYLVKFALGKYFHISDIQVQVSGYDSLFQKLEEEQRKLREKLKESEEHKNQLQKELKLTRNSLIAQDKGSVLDKLHEQSQPPRGMMKRKSETQEQKKKKQNDATKQKIKLLQQSFQRQLNFKNNQINDLKHKYEELDQKFANSVRKFSEEVANLSNGLQLKQRQYQELLSERNSLEEDKKYFEAKWQQKMKTPKSTAEFPSKQSQQTAFANMRQIVQLKRRVKDYEKTNSNLTNKIKKQKQMIEATQKACKERLGVKAKAFDELLEAKKNLSIEVKVLTERLSNLKSTKQIFQAENAKINQPSPLALQSKIRVKQYTDEDYYRLKQEYDELEQKNIELELQKRKQQQTIDELSNKVNTNEQKQQILEKKNVEQSDELRKSIMRQKQKRETIEKKFEQFKQTSKNEAKKYQKQIKQKKEQLEMVKQIVQQMKKNEETLKQNLKEQEKKEQQLIKVVNKMEEGELEYTFEEEKKVLVKCYEDRINKIENQLKDYIEKYNNAKIELTDQLDGKSDMVRNVQFDLQRNIEVLKEQNQLLENRHSETQKQLQQKQVQIQTLKAQLDSKNAKQVNTGKEKEQNKAGQSESEVEQMQKVVAEYEAKLAQKQQELNGFIEKYNDLKIELTDQLDGKSDMVRNVQFDMENAISTLKEENGLLEKKAKQMEEELDLERAAKAKTRKDIEKLEEKNSILSKEVNKLNQELFEAKLELQELKGEEAAEQNLLDEDSYNENSRNKSEKAQKVPSKQKVSQQGQQKESPQPQQQQQQQISQLEQKLKQKDQQLLQYIQKYNDIKVQLTDQLDGKSDLMHNVEQQLQNTIAILKERLAATENKLEQVSREKSQAVGNQEEEVEKLKTQLREKDSEIEKLFNEIMSKNGLILELEERLGELGLQGEEEENLNENEKSLEIVDADDEEQVENLQKVGRLDSAEEQQEREKIAMGGPKNRMLGEDFEEEEQLQQRPIIEDMGQPTDKFTQEQRRSIVAEYEARLQQKEKQLNDFIQKYNNLKIELTDQLDGKSDMVRNVQFDLQRNIEVLKEQNQLFENRHNETQKQLQQKQAQIQTLKAQLDSKNTKQVNAEKEKEQNKAGQSESEVEQMQKVVAEYEAKLAHKQQELNGFIEKYNDLKIELTDQLDGKSDMVRNVQFDMENAISTLKEENGLLEKKAKQMEEELDLERAAKAKTRKDVEKLEEKNSILSKEVNKLNQELFEVKLELQELKGEEAAEQNLLDEDSYNENSRNKSEKAQKVPSKQKVSQQGQHKESPQPQQQQQQQISQLEQKLKQKDQQLLQYIQKYNDIKVQLTDQLDGKSDLMHNVEQQLQNTIAILKERLAATENKLEQVSREKSPAVGNQEEEVEKFKTQLREKDSEIEKLFNEIMSKNGLILELEERLGELGLQGEQEDNLNENEKSLEIVDADDEEQVENLQKVGRLDSAEEQQEREKIAVGGPKNRMLGDDFEEEEQFEQKPVRSKNYIQSKNDDLMLIQNTSSPSKDGVSFRVEEQKGKPDKFTENIIRKYEKLLEQKQKQLNSYIQKYNNVKIELTEQLQGKSDMVRTVQYDLQSTIEILKQQITAQEIAMRSLTDEIQQYKNKCKKLQKEIDEMKIKQKQQIQTLQNELQHLKTKQQQTSNTHSQNIKNLQQLLSSQLKQKDNEINRTIQKLNKQKLQLINELDNKSSINRNNQQQNQRRITIMKQHLQLQQQIIKKYQHDQIQMQKKYQEKINQLEMQLYDQRNCKQKMERELEEIKEKLVTEFQNSEKEIKILMKQREIGEEEIEEKNQIIRSLQEKSELQQQGLKQIIDKIKKRNQNMQKQLKQKQQIILNLSQEMDIVKGSIKIKEEELMKNIEKHNLEKQKLMDELDGRSEAIRSMKFDTEGQVGLLKQQVEALETKIKGYEEDLQKQTQENKANKAEVAKLKNTLAVKEEELMKNIEKHNLEKQKLMDGLDSRSEAIRSMKFDTEGQVGLLKQQVEALETKIKGYEEDLQKQQSEVAKLKNTLAVKEEELMKNIEKHNLEKQKLMDELDGRSEAIRSMKFDTEGQVGLLKQQVEALETKIKGYEEDLQKQQSEVAKLKNTLAVKEEELMKNIEKHNLEKQKLMDGLDSRSEAIRSMKFDTEGQVGLLKQQVEALETKIKGYEEDLQKQTQENKANKAEVAKLKNTLAVKEEELMKNIEKHNLEKQKLMDELDGRSEAIRSMKFDTEGQVGLLKQQVEALETKIKGYEEDLQKQTQENKANKAEVAKLKNTLAVKEEELMKNIEKHNLEKQKLMDELDGRSEAIRSMKFDTEGQVGLLKQQVEALETKIKGYEEDLQKQTQENKANKAEVAKLKNTLAVKEEELMKNIEKHNLEKQKLMDELDGRSEAIRSMKFDTEGQVGLLKQQVEALETKIKGYEEDLQKQTQENKANKAEVAKLKNTLAVKEEELMKNIEKHNLEKQKLMDELDGRSEAIRSMKFDTEGQVGLLKQQVEALETKIKGYEEDLQKQTQENKANKAEVAKLKNTLAVKEEELMKNIEKHNLEKQKLMDELDGRSEAIRSMKFDTEGQVGLLKQQVEALETKIKGYEEDLQKQTQENKANKAEVAKLKNTLAVKEEELMKNIEKHNLEKQKLMDELDGRSEAIRSMKFDTEGQVGLLKQQVEALETKIKGYEEDLQKQTQENKANKAEVAKLKNTLAVKEEELMKNIEKHNLEKQKLMDELDGRSEAIRSMKFDTEGQVGLLKQQVEALETKIKGYEEDLQKQTQENKANKAEVAKLKNTLAVKEEELMKNIEKHNLEKQKLMDELDGRSEAIRSMKFDTEGQVGLLKQQVEALETKIKGYEEDLQKQTQENKANKAEVAKLKNTLAVKEEELMKNIEKHNLEKQKLMDELDGRSEAIRSMKFDTEGQVGLLKQQVEALETKIKGYEEDLQKQTQENKANKAEVAKLKNTLAVKEEELMKNIEKHNLEKQKLMDELDGRSEAIRSMKFDTEGQVGLLKQQVEALETKIKGYEEDLQKQTQENKANKAEVAKLKNTLAVKEEELMKNIEKHNLEKQKLMDELDGRSEAIRSMKFDTEGQVGLLKQQVEALETKIKGYEEDLQKQTQENKANKAEVAKLKNTLAVKEEELMKNIEKHNLEKQKLMDELDGRSEAIRSMKFDTEGQVGLLKQQVEALETKIKGYEEDLQKQTQENKANKAEVAKLKNTLAVKEEELMKNIEKHNLEKQKLMDELDGRSEAIRSMKFDTEGQVGLLKQQVEALETKIKGYEEDLQKQTQENKANKAEVAKLKNTLAVKEEELMKNIEKHNLEKQKLMDELDGRSEAIRSMKFDTEGQVGLLKQQVEALETKIKGYEEDLQKQTQENKANKAEVAKLKNTLAVKEEELMKNIEKHNLEKQKLMDELDGRSEAIRSMKFDTEGQVGLLKQQVEALETKIKGYEEDLQKQTQENKANKAEVAKLKNTLAVKEEELMKNIEKHNLEKQKLMDELDGRSEAIRSMKFDTEGQVGLLKQQVEALETKIKGYEETIQQNSSLKQQVDALQSKISQYKQYTIQLQNKLISHTKSTQKLEPPSSPLKSKSQPSPPPTSSIIIPPSSVPLTQHFDIATEQQIQQQNSKSKISSLLPPRSPISNQIPFNSKVFEQYLQSLKFEIINQIQGDQPFYTEEFIQLHSPDGVLVLESLRNQIIRYIGEVKNSQILQQLAFIDKNGFDFCQNCQQQISQLIQTSQQKPSHSPQLLTLQSQNTTLLQQISKLKQQLLSQSSQITQLIQQKEADEQQNERQFINQSQIYKKQILKQKQRADTLTSSLESLKKVSQKMLEILFDDSNLSDDLEECFQHYCGILGGGQQIRRVLEEYKGRYEKMREMIDFGKMKAKEKDKQPPPKQKSKKGWF